LFYSFATRALTFKVDPLRGKDRLCKSFYWYLSPTERFKQFSYNWFSVISINMACPFFDNSGNTPEKPTSHLETISIYSPRLPHHYRTFSTPVPLY